MLSFQAGPLSASLCLFYFKWIHSQVWSVLQSTFIFKDTVHKLLKICACNWRENEEKMKRKWKCWTLNEFIQKYKMYCKVYFSHTIIFLNAIEEKMNGAFIDDTKQA